MADLAEQFERDVKPLFGHLNAIGHDAARAAALATAQVERVDRLFTDAALRYEKTLSTVQDSVIGPVREGRALISAFKAAIQAVRELRQNGRARPGRGWRWPATSRSRRSPAGVTCRQRSPGRS